MNSADSVLLNLSFWKSYVILQVFDWGTSSEMLIGVEAPDAILMWLAGRRESHFALPVSVWVSNLSCPQMFTLVVELEVFHIDSDWNVDFKKRREDRCISATKEEAWSSSLPTFSCHFGFLLQLLIHQLDVEPPTTRRTDSEEVPDLTQRNRRGYLVRLR